MFDRDGYVAERYNLADTLMAKDVVKSTETSCDFGDIAEEHFGLSAEDKNVIRKDNLLYDPHVFKPLSLEKGSKGHPLS
jgi:hypothetical protein